jgi:hypothetical protein
MLQLSELPMAFIAAHVHRVFRFLNSQAVMCFANLTFCSEQDRLRSVVHAMHFCFSMNHKKKLVLSQLQREIMHSASPITGSF